LYGDEFKTDVGTLH